MAWFYSLQLRSADPAKRIQAASNLSDSGSWRAVEPLIHALADNDREVRKHAKICLGSHFILFLFLAQSSLTSFDLMAPQRRGGLSLVAHNEQYGFAQ